MFGSVDMYAVSKARQPNKKLTHTGGQVVQYDEYDIVRSGELLPTFPEENIIRPWFQRGSEVMVYDDTWSIHSAPDHIHREAVWRFM